MVSFFFLFFISFKLYLACRVGRGDLVLSAHALPNLRDRALSRYQNENMKKNMLPSEKNQRYRKINLH